MANEIQAPFRTGRTCYAIIRNQAGQVWNGTAMATYASGSYSLYPVTLTEQGTSGYYAGNFPTGITTPGVYNVVVKEQIGGSAAETDPDVDAGEVDWNGSSVYQLTDIPTSGTAATFGTVRIAKGTMIQNFHIYLKSAADHVTPFTSGVVSGQILRDGGTFGAFQSGLFTEEGNGFYRLLAMTSGDTNGNTLALLFTAAGISGGSADPLPLSVVTQRVSGQ